VYINLSIIYGSQEEGTEKGQGGPGTLGPIVSSTSLEQTSEHFQV